MEKIEVILTIRTGFCDTGQSLYTSAQKAHLLRNRARKDIVVTDFDLELGPCDELSVTPAIPDPPRLTVNDFQYDLYDWDDPVFRRQNRGPYAFRPVLLTQGYFMMVSPREYEKMTRFPDGSEMKWQAKTDRNSEGNIVNVYARRRGRSGEPRDVYAHRMVMDCLFAIHKVVDHKNGIGLDNRATKSIAINLEVTSQRRNMHNAVRPKIGDLKAGVEKVGPGKRFFGGKICKRQNNGKVKTVRSKRHWLTQEPAHQWYLNQLKRRNGNRTEWAASPQTVHFPIMPPRWEVEPEPRRGKLSKRALERRFPRHVSQVNPDREVPF